jgi:hypothetical protein
VFQHSRPHYYWIDSAWKTAFISPVLICQLISAFRLRSELFGFSRETETLCANLVVTTAAGVARSKYACDAWRERTNAGLSQVGRRRRLQ